MHRLLFCFLILMGLCLPGYPGEDDVDRRPPASVSDTYELAPRDLIRFVVLNEDDTRTEQRIDGQGRIRVPYLGPVRVAGHTVREAERGIERAYRQSDIYINPQVTIQVAEYATREASVLGQVRAPGNVTFPIEAKGIDIRDAISQAGGFTNIARSRRVVVTRVENGREVVHEVDVDKMLKDRRGDRESGFYVLPGDVVFVPERFF